MWAFVVGGSKGWRIPQPSSPFEPMANGMHGNADAGNCFVVGDYDLSRSNFALSCCIFFMRMASLLSVPYCLMSWRDLYFSAQT